MKFAKSVKTLLAITLSLALLLVSLFTVSAAEQEPVVNTKISSAPHTEIYSTTSFTQADFDENFTKWSKVYINDTKVSTTYLSSRLLKISREDMPEGENQVVVNQVGSSESIFRSSNTLSFERKADDADAAGNAGGAR